ncbi:MAG TPA: PmoA family protein [Candidatus Bathyarchaeia archaeon]|nr:PmoA family protein [Candidatus Bathyarchaeia archaeon]
MMTLLSTTAFSAGAAEGKVTIKQKSPTQLDVLINGEPFTTYNYSNDERKPYLWPLLAEGQVGVTRDWPMDPNAKVPGQTDHVHHKSFWTSYGDLNGVDCWGEEGDRAGWQHSDDVTFGEENGAAWIKAKNTWQDKDHKPVIAEDREYKFHPGAPSARVFDVTVTFTAAYGPVLWKDTKEGGIVAFRMKPGMQMLRGTGVITLSTGEKGVAAWGKPAPWCDYSGEAEGKGMRGIAIFDNPQNLRYPTRWHVRNYGLNGANCFGLHDFTDNKENGDFTLEDGKSITFKYRVVIHSGTAEEANLAKLYDEYVIAK